MIKHRNGINWTVIIFLLIFPVIIFFVFGTGIENVKNFSIEHVLGQVFGLIGMSAFALTLILSSKLKFVEKMTMGLDKAYHYHEILGGLAFVSLLFHPLFLVLKYVPKEINLAIKYLLPSSIWSVNYGIVSLTGMIVLIFMTYFMTVKYGKWKAFHRFLGVFFIFAVLHVFLIGPISKGGIFPGYYLFMTLVSFIGLWGFLYRLYHDFSVKINREYKIGEIKKKNSTFEITLVPQGKAIDYLAGQFASFSFRNEKISLEHHPFTIASSPMEKNLKIDVKILGDYTEKFDLLNVGDEVKVSGPHGGFNYMRSISKKQIWIAGGIGITPFISMAKDMILRKDFDKEILLIYSSKEHFVEEEVFMKLSELNPNFKFVSWSSVIMGKINLKRIKDYVKSLDGYSFFISGPVKMKEMLIGSLREEGIKRNRILEEDFEFV